ncbi:hypothetical protein D1872_98910 [compost metagenome]
MTNPFYKSKRWKRKRAAILRRDKYMCQESKRFGKSESAVTVHHIYPLEHYPELALKDWNLVSLSDKQHNAMHDRQSHELTELGKAWQARVREHFDREQGNKVSLSELTE